MPRAIQQTIPQALASVLPPPREIVAQWLHGRNESTVESYSLNIGRWISFLEKRGKHMFGATPSDCADYVQAVREDRKSDGYPIAQKTIVLRVRVVKSFYAWAVSEGMLECNPTEAISVRNEDVRVCDRLISNRSSAQAMALSAPSFATQVLIRLLLDLDLTTEQVAAIRWCDFIGTGRRVKVRVAAKGESQLLSVSASLWNQVQALHKFKSPTDPNDLVFGLEPREIIEIIDTSGGLCA